MKLTVEKPRVTLGEIAFTIIGRPRLDGLDRLTGPLTLEVDKLKKRRSLDANAYCWALLDKLSAAMKRSALDLYRDYIRTIGGVSKDIDVAKGAPLEEWQRIWTSRGRGWICEVLDDSAAREGCVIVRNYFGSSVYDTSQMSRLIDAIVQDCQSIGIDTIATHELEALLSDWRNKSE